ncbi:MAG: hypothetical protein SGBAC_007568, partial [Bacillariaceae sp.]
MTRTTCTVQATSHGSPSYNNYARAANLASQHAAQQERQSLKNRGNRPKTSKPQKKKKKTMEEGIQNAKRFPKVVLLEEMDRDEEESDIDYYLPAHVSDDDDEDEDEDNDGEEDALWGISSGFEPQTMAVAGNDEDECSRRRKGSS